MLSTISSVYSRTNEQKVFSENVSTTLEGSVELDTCLSFGEVEGDILKANGILGEGDKLRDLCMVLIVNALIKS